jgi:DNA-binding beta-propeller fold protein YncE
VARFWNPVNVAYRDGTVVVADFDNGALRLIGVETNVTSSIDPGPNFRRPFGLSFANDETLYVSTDNNPSGVNSDMTGTIWRVSLPTKTAQVVSADMGRPRGIVVLPDGRIAATDYLHHVVQLVDPDTGAATVIAGAWDEPGYVDGPGADARFSMPYGIGRLPDDTLVVADRANNRIRLVALDGTTSTLAGSGGRGFHDGCDDEALFNGPLGLSVAADGDVYVTDSDNYRVRLISGCQVTTVAGNGVAGHADADDPLQAQFYGLEGLVVTPDGETLYVADGNRGEDEPFNRIRQVLLP